MFAPNSVVPIYTNVPPPALYPAINNSPVVALFISNISDKIPESAMKTILDKCGEILNWKRVQGASGKLQAFGLCEYENPEATLRCIRLLNGFKVADKSLLVKVDPKTDELLKEYLMKVKKTIDEKYENLSEEEKQEKINQLDTKRNNEDKVCLNEVKKILEDIGLEYKLNDNGTISNENEETIKTEKTSVKEESQDKKSISKEIESIRNKRRNSDTEDDGHRSKKLKKNDRDRRSKEKHESRRHRSRSRSRHSHRTKPDDRRKRHSKTPPKKQRSNSKDSHKSLKTKKTNEKELDEYETAVFKKLEKKLRDKEASYQKRLQAWESREKRQSKEYLIEEEREKTKKNDLSEEARKLKIFFEEYDDEILDAKYYTNAEFERRWTVRQTEESTDAKDRSKEIEQIENTRRRLLKENNPDVEEVILKMEQSMQEHLKKRLISSVDDANGESGIVTVKSEKENVPNEIHKSENQLATFASEKNANANELLRNNVVDKSIVVESENCDSDLKQLERIPNNSKCPVEENSLIKAETSDKDNNNQDQLSLIILPPCDDNNERKTKKNLEDETNQPANDTNPLAVTAVSTPDKIIDRKIMMKKIIDAIPTSKEELFSYKIEWDMIDENFVEMSMKPWINKKIIEYIGEDEPTLSKFICDQVLEHKTPDQILDDISMVLEEEAEIFVMKMWRLLIYVIEEKKVGMVKCNFS